MAELVRQKMQIRRGLFNQNQGKKSTISDFRQEIQSCNGSRRHNVRIYRNGISHGRYSSQGFHLRREKWMQRINRANGAITIEKQQILQRLLPRGEYIDNVLRQGPAHKRRDGTHLAAKILEELAQEFGIQRFRVELEEVVGFARELGEFGEVDLREGREGAEALFLEFPECAQAA